MRNDPAKHAEIYVVDDDAAVRGMMLLVFSGEGYEVACFAHCASLLAAAREKQPVSIFFDLQVASGLDILKPLRAEDNSAFIFMLWGNRDIAIAIEAIKHGASEVMEKPAPWR